MAAYPSHKTTSSSSNSTQIHYIDHYYQLPIAGIRTNETSSRLTSSTTSTVSGVGGGGGNIKVREAIPSLKKEEKKECNDPVLDSKSLVLLPPPPLLMITTCLLLVVVVIQLCDSKTNLFSGESQILH